MIVTTMLAVLAASQTPTATPVASAGEFQMVSQSVAAKRDAALQAGDPALLINSGIEFARMGRTEEARAMFEAAMHSETRYDLQTASGEWKDSRWLARTALAMLDGGEFTSPRMVAR